MGFLDKLKESYSQVQANVKAERKAIKDEEKRQNGSSVSRLGKSSGLRVQDAIKEDDKTYLDIDHSLFF